MWTLLLLSLKLPFPIAVTLDNTARGRPQMGLSAADLVYEIRVEGGITRFMALYSGEAPPVLGPVRSVRHYFLPFVMEHGALLVHAGADPRGWNDLVVYRVPEHDAIKTALGFFRDPRRKAPYNLYVRVRKILPYLQKAYPQLVGRSLRLPWEWGAPTLASRPAKRVRVVYAGGKIRNISEWRYDEKSGMYVRYVSGRVLRDAANGEPIRARNLIYLSMRHRLLEGAPNWRITITTIGSGEGLVVSEGRAERIRWTRRSWYGPTRLTHEDGTPVRLPEGATWIHVVPTDREVQLEG